jgi:glycosyltransferase involved in cell wall biosynthesis
MRPQFRDAAPWNLENCRRYRIFCTSSCHPLKGLHVLIEALHRLRQAYPDVRLSVAGSGFGSSSANAYARLILKMISRWNLSPVIEFQGHLDAQGLLEEMRKAHIYISPSFIENSSNALQEAMLAGIPCVGSYTGGTPDMLSGAGLLFPVGDAALLSHQSARIFDDDELAQQLATQARAVAIERDDPARVERQVLDAYCELGNRDNPSARITSMSQVHNSRET